MATSETIQPVDLTDPTEKATWQIAHQAAEKISTVYYRAFDKQGRPDISTFFVETSSLIWNGNQVVGRQAIVEFLAKKLPKSMTTVHTLSAQPVQSKGFFLFFMIALLFLLIYYYVFWSIFFGEHLLVLVPVSGYQESKERRLYFN